MKISLFALFVSATLFSCNAKPEKTLKSKEFTENDDFNQYPKSKDKVLTIEDIVPGSADSVGSYAIKYKDTTLYVQNGSKPLVTKFREARFINSQKTAVLVQVEDGAGIYAPFYVIGLNDGQTSAVSLSKPSSGKGDKDFAKGLQEITRTTLVVNNDFVVATVRGKVYPIKRKNSAELIQGNFILYSADKGTLVFALDKSLYQVNYISGETLEIPVEASLSQSGNMVNQIQQDYAWEKNARGTSFLKPKPDDNRVVDISEFKK